MRIEGKARGGKFKDDLDFILKENGAEGLRRVEEKLAELGFPLKYKEIKEMEFYPIGLRVLLLLAIKEVFGFSDEKIKMMGMSAAKVSLIMRFFMQYFFSLSKVFKEASQMWKKYYTVGKLIPMELNEEKKFVTLRVEDFNIHPIICPYLAGYFSTVVKMVVKNSVFVQETKCVFNGGNCHEFLLKW